MTETSSNPLIAQREDSTQWYSGVSVFETVSDLHSAISSGSWIDGGLGVLGVGMEAVSLVIDPIGTIASYGVGFLIEHVKPLSDALDWVAGDPDQIEAYAKTWENVATSIAETSATHKQAVEQDVAGWTGATADAYKKSAADTSSLLSAASTAAKAASDAVRMAGGIVAAVRMVVRDLVAQAVGRLAAWAAEEVFSFGVATPLVAAQAATFVAKTMTTIANLFRKLARTFAKLMPLLKRLKSVFADIAKGFKRTKSGRSAETPHGSRAKSTEDTSTKPSSTDTSTKPSSTSPESPKSTDTPKHADSPDGSTNTSPSQHNSPDGEKPNGPTKNADNDKDAPDKARGNNPEQTKTPKDTTTCGDPVDAATGEFLLPATDVDLPGVLGLVLGRRHRSNYRFGRWFGPSWSATLDMRIIVDQTGVTFLAEDGMLLAYPHTGPEVSVSPSGGGPHWAMTRSQSGGYRVFDPDREITWHFAPDPVLNGLDVRLGNYAISAITDRHHNRIRFSYNADGAPVEVVHSGGYRVRVDTANGRVTGISVLGEASDGGEIATRVREFDYAAGELVAVTNGVGATTTYTYDDAHRLLSWTDSNGNQMINTYDSTGRVVSQRGTNGILAAEFDYSPRADSSGTRTTFTNSLGARTVYEFDAGLLLRDVIDPTGARTHTDYTRDRKPVRVVAADGGITFYHHTDQGDLTKITRPDQMVITVDYQAANRPSAITDADGSVSRREYGSDGNLRAVINEANVRTAYTHHATGAVASITESTGARTTLQADAAGLLVSVANPHGEVTHVDRDHFGRLLAITDPLGSVTRYEWSAEGYPLRRVDPDGHSETWRWDGEGNLLTHTDRAGNQIQFSYGPFDLLSTRIDADGSATYYEWDTERRLVSVVNPLGQTWSYTHDSVGRVVSETDYSGIATRYEHDLMGRVAVVTSAAGVSRFHSHDQLGRLVGIRATTGEWVRYTYDPVGQLLSAISGAGEDRTHTGEFTYTLGGRILTERIDGRPAMRYEYDLHGRRTGRTSSTGAATAWHHDASSRVIGMATEGKVIDFTYDQLGRSTGWRLGALEVNQTFSAGGHILSRQVTGDLMPNDVLTADAPSHPAARLLRRDDYRWRPDGYIASHTVTRADARVNRRDYTLDAIGRVSGIADAETLTERYTYDRLNNVITAGDRAPTNPTSALTTMRAPASDPGSLDNSIEGNHRREYRNNLLIRDGRIRYQYDAAGRVIRKTRIRLSRKADVWHYRYNAFDQLVDVYTPDGQWWHYTYDALGRRASKQLLGRDRQILERIDYVWEADRLIEQTTSRKTMRWTYQPDTHTPITQSADGVAADRQFHAIISDLVGTPIELLEPGTGHTAATASGDLWGRIAWHGGTSTPLRFPGQIHDDETGLHYNYHRYYDPSTGRFIVSDPLGLAAGPNPYGYPHNPLTWTDPLGLRAARGGLQDDITLGKGYTARKDVFPIEGTVDFEVHVYHNGREVGIFGSNGWFAKHGHSADVTVPDTVANRLKSVAVEEMRRQGRLGPKGTEDICGDKWKRPRVGCKE
ncbi:RHS repeat-associated core domain-containing protein [Nocardia pseudovaccinii]|uniref:RHS repeat-associated core domain-containing protein n=1 Tax=Nocardia pseudovaccinii TaxID=189540 RepID=UPI003D940945